MKRGVPATPTAQAATEDKSSKPDTGDDEFNVSCDSNPFAAIISEGESSDEEPEEEENSSAHSYSKAQDDFIKEANKRCSMDQHCMCDNSI